MDNPVADGRWPVHCTYGDGTEIEPEVLAHLRQTVWANTVRGLEIDAVFLRELSILGCFGWW